MSNRSLPYHITVFWITCLPVVSHPLNHLVIHREETHLDGSIDEIGKEGSNQNEQSYDPEKWSDEKEELTVWV